MKYTHYFRLSIKSAALTTAVFTAMTSSAVTIPNTPLVTQINAKPMVMLIAGKDHKLFYEAYNDTADIDGDGSIDIRFKPPSPITDCSTPTFVIRTTATATITACLPRNPSQGP